uniref:Protein kinase domain-containing protein n=1 Tax=Caenorhabditis tropicalis TaxID=1561998 RepID=A0A1I7UDB4_9PELO
MLEKLVRRFLGRVHASTSCPPPITPPLQFLLFPTMDKLMDEICREKQIVDRCKKSIDRKEPYDLISMKQQIDISLSKITAMKMRLIHMQNSTPTAFSTSYANPSPSTINQQILNTQLLCHGAIKVRDSLIREETPNEKVLRETEQTILVLNEKLELLIQCSNQRESICTPISVRRTRDGSTKSRRPPIQVSGLLKIRVTGLADLPRNTKPRQGRYASEYLAQAIKKKKSMFSRHGFRRYPHRAPAINDYIVIIHVGGKEVATMVWNEKKTMVGGDEETIQLFKSRQLDFEVYHTDSRSLCAIGSMQLESLLDEHDAKDPYATFAHRVVNLMPEGSLHFQTTYSDPEQSMEKRLGEHFTDSASKLSLSIRKNGSVLARGSQTRFMPRTAISVSQFVPPTPSVKPPRTSKVDSLESYRMLSVIGVGAFGTVKLGQRVEDDMYCAIKIIDRDKRTRKFDTPELQILKTLHHPFICSLMTSFMEDDSLHLVLEFCEAGDLHTHLSRTAHGFTRQQVLFFASSILLAVEYLHRKLYVHRDLKTENMMLTRSGILKIIDFGLCKKLQSRNEKMCDVVGTSTHLAAEIHRREPYGIEMDWWAVGVSLYQLRTREQPFYGNREVEMQKNSRVREWHTFNDLLVGLMAIHPEARLGYHSTEDVKNHPFFMDIDLDAVLNGTISAPYVPLMTPGLDLEYFDNPYHSELDTSSSSFTSVNSFLNLDMTV